MKNIVLSMVLFGAFATAGFANRANLTIRVVEETGTPISDATVRISFFEDTDKIYVGQSDTNGLFGASGNPPFAEASYSIKKDGYYWHRDEYKFPRMQDLKGKGESRNQTNTVVLKRIKNPIPMCVKRVEILLPAPDQEFGYDLQKGDLVIPYGLGAVSDLVFKVEGYYKTNEDYDGTLKLKFSNKGDGIQPFEKVLARGSVLHSSHFAPENGYLSEWSWHKSRKQLEATRADIIDTRSESRNYFFRVRTVFDERGNIVSALYGKIYGDLDFGGASKEGSYLIIPIYYLNPQSNDRNVEFDSEKNLFPENFGTLWF